MNQATWNVLKSFTSKLYTQVYASNDPGTFMPGRAGDINRGALQIYAYSISTRNQRRYAKTVYRF